MPDRCRDIAQHPNQPRPMAAEEADQDDEEAHSFYHHTNPPGYVGRHRLWTRKTFRAQEDGQPGAMCTPSLVDLLELGDVRRTRGYDSMVTSSMGDLKMFCGKPKAG